MQSIPTRFTIYSARLAVTLAALAFAGLFGIAMPQAVGQDDAAAPKNSTTQNPIAKEEPKPEATNISMLGVFSADTTTVRITKRVGNDYEGTIQTINGTYRLEGKQVSNKFDGVVKIDGAPFAFYSNLEGDVLHFRTGLQKLTLKRLDKNADAMLGVFIEGSTTVRIEKNEGKTYEGTIQGTRGFYPLKSTRKGDDLSGTYKVDDKDLPFTATLKSDLLLFRAGEREFKMVRRGVSIDPKTVINKPVEITSPPLEMRPKKADSFDDHGLPQNRLWLKFDKDIYADYEITQASPGTVPEIFRHRYSIKEIKDGTVVLAVKNYVKNKWYDKRTSPWLTGSRALSGLGLSEGKTRTEQLDVNGTAIRCQVTSYTYEAKGDAPATMQLEVWRNSDMNLPLQAISIGPLVLAMESDMVRLQCKTNSAGLTTDMDFVATDLKKSAIVGNWSINCVAFNGNTLIRRADGDFKAQYIKWVSNEVPGGVVRQMEFVSQGTKAYQRNQTLVGFGRLAEFE